MYSGGVTKILREAEFCTYPRMRVRPLNANDSKHIFLKGQSNATVSGAIPGLKDVFWGECPLARSPPLGFPRFRRRLFIRTEKARWQRPPLP